VPVRQRQEVQKMLRALKPLETKLFSAPLQAMIQMIIIDASTESERLWKRFNLKRLL
jgi:hypothetical protein